MPDTIEIPGVPTLGADGIADLPPLDAPMLEPEPGETAPPAEPVKRRRRRRTSKTAEPAPVDPGPNPEQLAHLSTALGAGFMVAGNVLAAARGAHWQVTADEQKMLGDVWAPALAPYMGGTGRYMPFILATITTVGVFLPRLQQDRAGVRGAPVPSSALPVESFTIPGSETAAAEPTAPAPAAVEPDGAGIIPIEPPPAARRRTGSPKP